MAKNFIQKAIKRPGALTRKAQAAGMSTQAYASAHAGDSGLTGQQARFAQMLNKVRPGGTGGSNGKSRSGGKKGNPFRTTMGVGA